MNLIYLKDFGSIAYESFYWKVKKSDDDPGGIPGEGPSSRPENFCSVALYFVALIAAIEYFIVAIEYLNEDVI